MRTRTAPAATTPGRSGRCRVATQAATQAAVLAAVLAAAGSVLPLAGTPCLARGDEPAHSAELDAMIVRAAKRHGVPERLLRRIVMRESKYNPHARNHKYWGLMQISVPTARSMGFSGSPEELLNPLTNLTYAVPYLANAFVAAGRSEEAAVRLYASGYYDTAKRRGVLGLLRTAGSTPIVAVAEPATAVGAPPESGFFGSLFAPTARPDAEAQFAAATPQAPAPQAPALQASASPADGDPAPVPNPGALPEGRPTRGGALLAVDRSGRSRPPPKWLHDGGLTVLARGEQDAASFAATRHAGEAAPSRRAAKNAVFASLDPPGQAGARPASAQAYAASASDESAAPQAAIAQALVTPAPASVAKAGDDDERDGKAPHRRRRHHARHHGAEHGHAGATEAADASAAAKP